MNFAWKNNIQINLSYDIPKDYETVFETYDCTIDTLFSNTTMIEKYSSIKMLFFFFIMNYGIPFNTMIPERVITVATITSEKKY